MTAIQIFGVPASSYVRTVRMVALEKGLAHTVEPAPEGLHPWKRVPAMRHGDVTLIETSAIARYLDDIGTGPKLVPATPHARAVMEQWISIFNSYIYAPVIRDYAVRGYIVPKLQGRGPDADQIRAAVPELERNVKLLDAAYTHGTYIAGDSISLADLLVAPAIATITLFPEGQHALASAPNLARGLELVRKRETFAKVHEGL